MMVYVIRHNDKYVARIKPRRTYTKFINKAAQFDIQAAVLEMRVGEAAVPWVNARDMGTRNRKETTR